MPTYSNYLVWYKIINNIVAVPFSSLFKFALNSNTRGHPLKLLLPESRVNARAHAFPVHVITVWNRLLTDVVLASSLSLLKYNLKNVSFSY